MAPTPAQPRGTEARLMKDGDRLERERKRLEDRLLRERQKVRRPVRSGAPRPGRATESCLRRCAAHIGRGMCAAAPCARVRGRASRPAAGRGILLPRAQMR